MLQMPVMGRTPLNSTSWQRHICYQKFWWVGTGVQPTAVELAEVDTLQFDGDGLTARNPLLTQADSDLVIGFEGIRISQSACKILTWKTWTTRQSTGASDDVGNILFDGLHF